MNAYRVHVSYKSQAGDAYGEMIHVTATSRETALYATFDEMTDHGYTVQGFREVYVLVNDQWHETNDHTETARA